VEYQVFCRVHRRFILQSWAVGIISTYSFAPSYTVSVSGSLRKPLRSLPDLYPSHCRSHQNSVTPEAKDTGPEAWTRILCTEVPVKLCRSIRWASSS